MMWEAEEAGDGMQEKVLTLYLIVSQTRMSTWYVAGVIWLSQDVGVDCRMQPRHVFYVTLSMPAHREMRERNVN